MHWTFVLRANKVLLEQMVYGCASVIIRGSEYLLSSHCSSVIAFVYKCPSVRGVDGLDSTLGLLEKLYMIAFF